MSFIRLPKSETAFKKGELVMLAGDGINFNPFCKISFSDLVRSCVLKFTISFPICESWYPVPSRLFSLNDLTNG